MDKKECESLRRQIEDLNADIKRVKANALGARQSMLASFKQVDACVKELQPLKPLHKALLTDIKDAEFNDNEREEIMNTMEEIGDTIQELNVRLVPATGSLFVRLFLGRVNVRHHRDGERFRLKEEYEKFRYRTNPILIVMPLILLVIPPELYILRTIFQVWMLYYYVTLALREHILIVNGSNINSWWLWHHYLSIALCITVLTWPKASPTYQRFVPMFLIFSICQGGVQILTNRYQLGRMYNLVARGEASRMDVVSNEPIIDKRFAPSLKLLLPFLLFLYFFQLYNAYELFFWYLQGMTLVNEWQVLTLAALFLVLGVGNMYTTLGSYYDRYFGSRNRNANKQMKRN